MAPPKKTQHYAHEVAARLYEARAVDTATSLGQLIKLIADSKAYPGMSAAAREDLEEAVKKAIQRAYKNKENRREQLWDGVVASAALPSGDPDFIAIPDDVLGRLKGERRASDPFFAEFTAAIADVEATDAAQDRVVALRRAADVLRALSSPAEPPVDVPDRTRLSERFSRLSGAWRSVYDAAVGGSGGVSDAAAEIAEEAIRAGCAAQRRSRAQPSGGFPPRNEGPRRMQPSDSDHWISAVAVLAVLRGVRAAGLVEHTGTWVAEHLEVTERASSGRVFAQAAATLMRIGGREAVREALEAAWDTGVTDDCWEELLDLSITLAAVMYGHDDRAGAASVLTPVVRGWLDGEYPGDPDEGWGASVDYRLYLLTTRALSDPEEVAGALRWAWVEEVGEGGDRRPLWVLTAMLVQTLLQIGATEEAARLTHVAPKLLEEPRTEVERQVAACVREMCATDGPVLAPSRTGRIGALLKDLLPLVLASPDAVDPAQRHVLKGLAELATAARFGPRIQVRLTA
jgi:hypothetical protein